MSSELTWREVEDFASERPKRGEIAPAMWVYKLATALLAAWEREEAAGVREALDWLARHKESVAYPAQEAYMAHVATVTAALTPKRAT